MKFLVVAVWLAAMTSPAFADEYFAVTPSGATEAVFDTGAKSTISKLSNKCMDRRWQIVAATENQLTCEAPMSFGQSLLGQLALGNSYSTAPRQFFRFNVAEIEGRARVQASGWMELQMAFGQIRRTDFTGPAFHNGAISFLLESGGRLPAGTTFPNHVMMGFQATELQDGKYAQMRVTSVVEGSPAAEAGIRVGDIVSKVAGKRFKNADDYLDATAKAAETPTYKVSVSRDGKSQDLVLRRAFRPALADVVQTSVPKPVVNPGIPSADAAHVSPGGEGEDDQR